MSPRPSVVLLAVLIGSVAVSAGPSGCAHATATATAEPATGESLVARGILAASAQTLILFAEVHHCAAQPALPGGQVFVSTDAGKTWTKRGPELEGSSFELALATTAGQLWVAGLHTAEGPGIDPFVLVPGAGPWALVLRPVREGPSELARATRLPQGTLFVSVRDVDNAVGGPPGGEHTYESRDQGVTWKESTAAVPPGATPFVKLGNESDAWRIADRPDGGFDLQQLTAKTWQTVTPFPWRACNPRP